MSTPNASIPPESKIIWTCVDCRERIEGVNHSEYDCPGKQMQRCKNCGGLEADHYYETCDGEAFIGCEKFEAIRYAGNVASPEREQELYAKAMRGEL